MKITNLIPVSVTRSLNAAKFQMVKHSPTILMAVGVAGVVTSTVMACRATLDLDEILSMRLEHIRRFRNAKDEKNIPEYTEENFKNDVKIVNTKTVLDIVKLYGPSVVVGAVSIACIFQSHRILTTRNAALSAAYATLHEDFQNVLKRIDENVDEELANKIKYNEGSKNVDSVITHEDGSAETKTEQVKTVDPDASPYTFYFGPYIQGVHGSFKNPHWSKDPQQTLMHLRGVEEYLNALLRVKSKLFLNEALEELNLPLTKVGQIAGWFYDDKDPFDHHISLGIRNLKPEDIDPNLGVRVVFNVDGNIWETM